MSSGDKAGAGGYNLVGHFDMATSVQTAVTHVDGHTTGVLTQWTISTVCVTGQDLVAVHSPTDAGRQQRFVLHASSSWE